jgi:hypothetical protein
MSKMRISYKLIMQYLIIAIRSLNCEKKVSLKLLFISKFMNIVLKSQYYFFNPA